MYKDFIRGENPGARCRLVTSHGMVSGITTGPSFALEVLVRERSGGTDLLTSIQNLGVGPTNGVLMARFQIPEGHAVVILKIADGPDVGGTRAVILTPYWK